MKRMTQIAKELRDNGRMFSQTRLTADLACFIPVFKEGKVVFYEDAVTDQLMSMYKVRVSPKCLTPAPVEVAEITPEVKLITRFERMEKMLENISDYLDLTVPG